MNFEFDCGHIKCDNRVISPAEIMDILVHQQAKIGRLENELDLLDRGLTKRTYGERRTRANKEDTGVVGFFNCFPKGGE